MKNVKMSKETKLKIGIANKNNGIGRKASVETKSKMSKQRIGVTQWKRCKITNECAIKIKLLLMSGNTPKQVSDNMNIGYKIVNNIYSSNTYKSSYASGWNEFYESKQRHKNLTEQEIYNIISIYNITNNISEVQRKTGFCRKTIRKYINHN